jgi:hypothetical protein
MKTKLNHEKDPAGRKEIKDHSERPEYFPFDISVSSQDGSLFIKFVKPVVA